jgi:hypothetical protein
LLSYTTAGRHLEVLVEVLKLSHAKRHYAEDMRNDRMQGKGYNTEDMQEDLMQAGHRAGCKENDMQRKAREVGKL